MRRFTMFFLLLSAVICHSAGKPGAASRESAAAPTQPSSTGDPAPTPKASGESDNGGKTGKDTAETIFIPQLPAAGAALSKGERWRIVKGLKKKTLPNGRAPDKCPDCIPKEMSATFFDSFSAAMDGWNAAWNTERKNVMDSSCSTVDNGETTLRAACLMFEREKRNALVTTLYHPKRVVVENAAAVAALLSRSVQRCAHPSGFAVFRDELTQEEEPENSTFLASAIVHYLLTDYVSVDRFLFQITATRTSDGGFTSQISWSSKDDRPKEEPPPSRITLYRRMYQAASDMRRGEVFLMQFARIKRAVEHSADGMLRLRRRLVAAYVNRQRGFLFTAARQMDALLQSSDDESLGYAAKDSVLLGEIYNEAAAVFHAVGDVRRADKIYRKMIEDASGTLLRSDKRRMEILLAAGLNRLNGPPGTDGLDSAAALSYLRKAHDIVREQGTKNDWRDQYRGTVLYYLAEALLYNRQSEKALETFEQGMAISDAQLIRAGLIPGSMEAAAAAAALQLDKPAEAKAWLQQGQRRVLALKPSDEFKTKPMTREDLGAMQLDWYLNSATRLVRLNQQAAARPLVDEQLASAEKQREHLPRAEAVVAWKAARLFHKYGMTSEALDYMERSTVFIDKPLPGPKNFLGYARPLFWPSERAMLTAFHGALLYQQQRQSKGDRRIETALAMLSENANDISNCLIFLRQTPFPKQGTNEMRQAALLLDVATLIDRCDLKTKIARRAVSVPLTGEEKEEIRYHAKHMLEQCEAVRERGGAEKTTELKAETQSPTQGKAGVEWVYSKPAGVYFTKTEVTAGQFKQCVNAGGCKKETRLTKPDYKKCNSVRSGRNNHPMNCVDWYEADLFCKWLGGGARLPTEEEWCAEASNGRDKRIWPWGDSPDVNCDYAIWGGGKSKTAGCKKEGTWPVCSKPRGNSISGLCDMSGNVWEWTSTEEGKNKVLRGGSWRGEVRDARSLRPPSLRRVGNGFRCVR